MNYKRLNVYIGWLVFLIATTVYFMTLEGTASLWDCGEFIATAYKLEVGHPPGAPLFMLVGRIFSLFAGSEADVAMWINRMSALCSSFSVLFLFWSITLLGKKVAEKDNGKMTTSQKIAVLGSGVVGALAYTFTESFWFSAVEGEVYAMSSLFTALIFWAILKWDEEITLIKRGLLTYHVHPYRWIVLIMFLIGLAIGVHLLGLLVLPAIGYIIAHQYYEKITLKTFVITGLLSIVVLAFIQNGVIPGTIAMASKFEIFFKNNLGLPFWSGAIFFFVAMVAALVFAIRFTHKKDYKLANTIVIGLIMILIGYGSFATITIRSAANPPLDENNPENLVTLHAFLKREQYGTWPILYGPYFNSRYAETSEFEDRSENYDRRWVVLSDRGSVITSFKEKSDAEKYLEEIGVNYKLEEKYFVTNEATRKNVIPTYVQNTIFPRMHVTGDARIANGYKQWINYDPERKVSRALIGEDGRPLPTFGNNIEFMMNYQMGWMYWRYFMWNFAGRQNDIQGHGDEMRGNWISGFSFIDDVRLGAQGENAPYFTKHNSSNYKFYFIPIILGLIGIFFHFLRSPKDAIVVTVLFVMTGIAIILYLNQKPFEPRERDYAYAASFYAFAIWIGLGVYGLYESFRSFVKEDYKLLLLSFGGLLALGIAADFGADRGMPATLSVLVIGAIAAIGFLLMWGLKKAKASGTSAAGLATLLGLTAPIIMGVQSWEGHDRSNRTSTRALAHNYLTGCAPNAILYTNGDNDTFPLWYLQEVEGERTDVRVANLSLMQTDWYSNQMKKRTYESDPLPIKFREDQILMGAGNTDYVLFVDYEMYKGSLSPEKANEIIVKKIEGNKSIYTQAVTNMRAYLARSVSQMNANDTALQETLNKMVEELTTTVENPGIREYQRIDQFVRTIFSHVQRGTITANSTQLEQLQDAVMNWTKSWDYLPLDYTMEFVRDDNNMLSQPGRMLRFFPASGFVLKVDKENVIKSEVVSEEYYNDILDEIRFDFRAGGLFRSDVRGLSREEVMMLDILANFEWSRGIYFSSPGGSDLAKALYAEGLLANLGQIHGLVPLERKAMDNFSREKMYENMMERFHFGNLAGEGVLVDYYTRRHTSQFRSSFAELASKYVTEYRRVKGRSTIDTLSADANGEEASYYADKVEKIVDYSLANLPIHKVLDFGEPRGIGQRLENGDEISTDGSVPELIRVLYEVDKIEKADQLAIEYLRQLETMINFYQHSDVMITIGNKQDFIAFSMNFLRTYAQIMVASPDGEAAELANMLNNRFSRDVIQKVVNDLKGRTVKEKSRGRTVTRTMEKEALEFVKLYNALLSENGFESE